MTQQACMTSSTVSRRSFTLGLTTLPLLAASAGPASAHSLKQLKDDLSSREEYFQAVDQPAPDFALIDADGKTVKLSDYRNKVVILNFIYAGCGDVCPLHSQLIVQLQSMINITPMKDHVVFISITTDPSNDKGATLTAYGKAQGLDLVNWLFLTSAADQPEDTTRTVAKAYGLEFTEADGMQMHGVVTNVIDRDGNLRARFHGLKFQPISLVSFVNALVNDLHGPDETSHESDDTLWSWFGKLLGGEK